ncbi:hypothetical protein ACFS5L_41145 [Streptomyces phyllanthi]|uniref:Glycosyltransferase RgtA/B/C/D-like domain-containing protein n=1 Tax=Streptomyces phyllanthi TaxID=1803180 RepID=A0A5N8VVW0_9ACTN|nr:hypothetical protein [Streptomyces phyllanthi]MPY39400.1 hypothetical protein [Streptomyces phyllanthi]
MVDSPHATLVGASQAGPPLAARRPGRIRRDALLLAVAAAFTLAQLTLVRPGMGLGWDETVYVSQVSPHAPAAFFSAPRARGVSWIVAPIAAWSSSTALLRIFLALLSGLALYLALRVWRGVFPKRVVALGGALFASLWVTLYYGPQAMPNYWVAIGALACAGCFLRARADRSDRAALWGVGAGAALMALMRPTDAVWATLPLLGLLLCVPRRRHLGLLAALLAGLAAGTAPWVIEAYISYGGLGQRLADGSRIQGGLGWNIAVDDQLRSLSGRTLCRPCTGPPAHIAVAAWWYALPLFAALGTLVAVRARRPAPTLVLVACAASAAVPYLFMIGYAAPRFLLPAYALLAIPVADGLARLVRVPGGKWRTVAVTLVVVGLAGHLAGQFAVLTRTVNRTVEARRDWDRTAVELHRLGVRPPCVLTGHLAIPIGFYAGCSSVYTEGNNTNVTRAELLRTSRRTPFAVLTPPRAAPPDYARGWPVHRSGHLDFYVAPSARPRG